jgi:alkylhydroperoxidase/carboxymuconolactone decarboxylase family protein YurZ
MADTSGPADYALFVSLTLVGVDPDLSKRERSLVTLAALVALARSEELPAH